MVAVIQTIYSKCFSEEVAAWAAVTMALATEAVEVTSPSGLADNCIHHI
jgi:hypothetical protein